MPKKQKKNNKIKLELDISIFHKILYVLGIILFITLIIKIFQIFLVPMAFSMVGWILEALILYPQLTTNAKFFGAIVFLILTFKVFVALVSLVEFLFIKTVEALTKLKEEKQ